MNMINLSNQKITMMGPKCNTSAQCPPGYSCTAGSCTLLGYSGTTTNLPNYTYGSQVSSYSPMGPIDATNHLCYETERSYSTLCSYFFEKNADLETCKLINEYIEKSYTKGFLENFCLKNNSHSEFVIFLFKNTISGKIAEKDSRHIYQLLKSPDKDSINLAKQILLNHNIELLMDKLHNQQK